MTVIQVTTDSEFHEQLTIAGTKLVVVDFFAKWCGPCRTIAPTYEQLSNKYNQTVFLKVDVDEAGLANTVSSNAVTSMPTFLFFKNRGKVDKLVGVNAASLEEKIKQHGGTSAGAAQSTVPGQMDLREFFDKSGMECLNEADDHPLDHALTPKGGFLESDCDEQLIIRIGFNQPVKLHSLLLRSPADKGPRVIKVFQNIPTLDFDSAENSQAAQILELTTSELDGETVIPLKFVKFQSVQSVILFVKNNQENTETTQIDYMGLFGSTVNVTNMAEFKRISGKKGESH